METICTKCSKCLKIVPKVPEGAKQPDPEYYCKGTQFRGREVKKDFVTGRAQFAHHKPTGDFYVTAMPFPKCETVNVTGECPAYSEGKPVSQESLDAAD